MMIVKVKAEAAGGHVHLGIWAGNHVGALGKAGTLCFRVEEWMLIMGLLQIHWLKPPERVDGSNVTKRVIMFSTVTLILEEIVNDE